nr:uncharacterized protein PB18E9.04c [Aegilops tauschii subsp. strangulata]XP_040255014.1 uncharacterized protein PB18E9.04c [Aegilops tauschii subsp. strangulata]XP_045089006.1 uncharacterized protein PB18E9.04c [Aegilops tauschii subsp. strangulata]
MSNTGDPVVLQDLRKTIKKVKKTTTRSTKRTTKDPLERIHSKLSTSGNADINEPPVDKTVAAPSIVPTSSDSSGRPSPPVADVQTTTTTIRISGSDESVSVRTAEILLTLVAMRDAIVTHATKSASVEVDAFELNLNKEDSRSSDTDSKRVAGGTSVSKKEGAAATFQNDRPSTDETHCTTAPAAGGPKAATATVARAGLPPRRRSPRKHPAQISNAPEVAKSSKGDSGYVPAFTLFPPPAKSNVMEKTKVRNTTDAGGKPCTTEGGERSEQTVSFTAVENTSLNLRTSKLPVNIGVPYSPNRKIGKKVVIETADSTPRPTNKPDDPTADEANMFVDLSPLYFCQTICSRSDW